MKKISLFLCFLLIFSLCFWQACTAKTLRSQNFIIQYEELNDSYAEMVSETAEKSFTTISGALGQKPGNVITVILTSTEKEFRELTNGTLPDWSTAVAMPGNRIIISPLPGMKMNLDRILAHEIVHVVLFDAAGGNFIPRWFHEGCAETFSGQWGIQGRLYMTWKVSWGKLMTFDEIEQVFSAQGADVTLAYDQSMLALKQLITIGGKKVLSEILDSMRSGDNFENSFTKATGMTVREFEQVYLAAIAKAYGKRTLLTIIPSTWTFILLLAIVVYIIKKRRNKRLMSQWEIVDAAENIIRFRPNPPDEQ
ncbi:MAG: hypothetical protein JXB48_10735 [Candidatus Latescibacteria bacterium]|nr:hypothetical protein [Candidatus Latescibacterota bacterium]